MSTRIICDRCGKDITRAEKIGNIYIAWKRPGTSNPEMDEMDFCEECTQKSLNFVLHADFAPEPVKTTPEPQKPLKKASDAKNEDLEPEKPEKKIDVGKIMALHKAGWTIRQIAEEMSMTMAAVERKIKIQIGQESEL